MKKYWNFIITNIVLLVVFILIPSHNIQSQNKKQQQTQQPQQQARNWTGNGGSGMSLAILAPQATGLPENINYLPALVQGEFVSNFASYSAISVLDRERLDNQYSELLSGYYDDNSQAGMDLGKLTPTTHIMGGNITRTATGYALQMQITRSSDKMTIASHSGTITFAELDNLTGIRRVSLDLLKKIGVILTERAQEELIGAAASSHVNAQTALARGVTAQSQGTEVAALSYYYQAAVFDPALREAANRSSILNANISSGNIGDNVRNDIAWRKAWVERLEETEQFFANFHQTESMPYTLFYISDEIRQGAVNYQNETVNLSFDTHLHGSGIWTLSMEHALQTVFNGLNAAGRKDTWGLGNWPRQAVTNLKSFSRRSNNFSVIFELLNDQNKVIGRQTLQAGGYWELSQNWSGGRPGISVSADERKTVNFQNVNANDISDRMTIRVATINGNDAEIAARNGVLQVRAISKNEFDKNSRYKYLRGTIQGFTNDAARDAEIITPEGRILIIPNNIWGDPVISIENDAFKNINIGKIIISNGVTSIGARAFKDNFFWINITIPNSIISIGEEAFSRHATTEGQQLAVRFYNLIINIKENVSAADNAFLHSWSYNQQSGHYNGTNNSFFYYYNKNNKKAGVYTGKGWRWKYSPH